MLTRVGVERLSFEDFYAAEYSRVLASAYAFCRDRDLAVDATQEAFVRAFARWRRLRNEEWAGAWVTTTALNVLRGGSRKETRQPSEAPSSAGAPSDTRLDLIEALRTLPVRQRQAAILFYVADLPVAVVASSLNLSDGAVKSHLSRAREALRTRLGDDHG